MSDRYNRQEKIENWQQEKLSNATVKIVGCGALGNVVGPILTAIGVGSIEFYDFDKIEQHNLARQWMFREEDVGKLKAEVLQDRLRERNSEIVINGYPERIDEDSYEFLLDGADVLMDAVDNVRARYWINKFAIDNDVPLVHMGSSPLGGEVCVITRDVPCLNCIGTFSDLKIEDPESCTNVVEASIADTNAIIGSIGASQARILLLGLPEEKNAIIEPMLYLKIRSARNKFSQIHHEKKPDCEICGN
jgi:molybdopterin/thiamine biosynthesis adenylyltransferase